MYTNRMPITAEHTKILPPSKNRIGISGWRTQSRRCKPFVDVRGNMHLPSFPQKFIATDSQGHAFSLLPQVDRLLN